MNEEQLDLFEGGSMKTVTVKKSELLQSLKANLDEHAAQLLTFQEERNAEMRTRLQKVLDEVSQGLYGPDHLSFPMAPDHREDYRRAIRMVEMSVDDTIELDQHEFNQYVMDNWGWKENFLRTASTYNGLQGKLK